MPRRFGSNEQLAKYEQRTCHGSDLRRPQIISSNISTNYGKSFTGPMAQLMEQAIRRQKQAYRPGTTANRQSAVNSLISFAVEMDFDYSSPSPEEICAYIESLVIRKMSPNAIKGHISSVKAFFRNAGMLTSPFETIQVMNAIRAVDLNVQHNPKTKVALSPEKISKIMTVLQSYQNGPMVAFAVSLMFTAFLRQSNLIPRTVKTFDPLRQITCSDVNLKKGLLQINIKWSKTNQKFGESNIVTVSQMPDSDICPVRAYIQTQPDADRKSHLPLIRFPDGNAVPLGFVNKLWKNALTRMGEPTKGMTLHRLRLSGASWANDQGVGQVDICKHGFWKSEAFRAYIVHSKTRPNKVNTCMSSITTNAV